MVLRLQIHLSYFLEIQLVRFSKGKREQLVLGIKLKEVYKNEIGCKNELHVVIEQLYSFELAIEALRKTETRQARGKLVVSLEES